LILQRTTSLGYKKIRIKEPLVLGISKPSGNYSVFMKEPTSFYSSKVPRNHENFNWQVSSGGGGGFMKWEQTTGNIYLYIYIRYEKPTKNQCCLKEPPNTGLNVAIFNRVNVKFGLGDPDIGMVYLKFGQQPKILGNLLPWYHCRCFFTQGGNVDQHSYFSLLKY